MGGVLKSRRQRAASVPSLHQVCERLCALLTACLVGQPAGLLGGCRQTTSASSSFDLSGRAFCGSAPEGVGASFLVDPSKQHPAAEVFPKACGWF